jgi:hypothetical protein
MAVGIENLEMYQYLGVFAFILNRIDYGLPSLSTQQCYKRLI